MKKTIHAVNHSAELVREETDFRCSDAIDNGEKCKEQCNYCSGKYAEL